MPIVWLVFENMPIVICQQYIIVCPLMAEWRLQMQAELTTFWRSKSFRSPRQQWMFDGNGSRFLGRKQTMIRISSSLAVLQENLTRACIESAMHESALTQTWLVKKGNAENSADYMSWVKLKRINCGWFQCLVLSGPATPLHSRVGGSPGCVEAPPSPGFVEQLLGGSDIRRRLNMGWCAIKACCETN